VPGRSNGLPATRYTPLVDLEPQLADALLEALRDEGVAAYAAPSPGVQGPYGDVRLPDGPTDRVWVDAGARARAREILSARLPEFQDALGEEHGTSLQHGPGTIPTGAGARPASETRPAAGADEDAAWQAIIDGWDLTSADPVPRWPASEDVDDGTPPAGRPTAFGGPPAGRPDDRPRRLGPETGPAPPLPGPGGRRLRPAGSDDEGPGVGPPAPVPPSGFPPDTAFPAEASLEPEDDPEDHYVPPPPPPLPRLDPLTKLAWVGVLGGPLYLLLAHLLNWVPIQGSNVLALFAFVGGFVGLVYRMKDDRGDGSDTDDGAVV
jgi:hypothetical protein